MSPPESRSKVIKRGDIILTVLLLLAGTASFFILRGITGRNKADGVRINAPGDVIDLPLKDTVLSVEGPLGETLVAISKGRVSVLQSPCPRKICVNQGRISRPGESIVCLPNRIVITLQGKSGTDAVSY